MRSTPSNDKPIMISVQEASICILQKSNITNCVVPCTQSHDVPSIAVTTPKLTSKSRGDSGDPAESGSPLVLPRHSPVPGQPRHAAHEPSEGEGT